MSFNRTRREKIVQQAFSRAGLPKNCVYVRIDSGWTHIALYASLGNIPMPEMRKLLWRLHILTPSGDPVHVYEGRRQLLRLTVMPE
jgi:hypothetical protein